MPIEPLVPFVRELSLFAYFIHIPSFVGKNPERKKRSYSKLTAQQNTILNFRKCPIERFLGAIGKNVGTNGLGHDEQNSSENDKKR